MRVAQLGQGLEVSCLGLGCMNLSMGYQGALPEAEALRLLFRAAELGITLFDTAEMYGPFENELLLGRALRQLRGRVIVSTKFGFRIEPGSKRPLGLDSRPEHIREVCDAALQRLNIDTIDLFYQHRVDPEVPIEEVAGAVGQLVREGKVRHFGLSEAGAATLRRAHAVFPVTALQTEYSLWSRDPETGVLPVCRELGIGFVAYSPLGRGFLAGAARDLGETDYRRSQPRWQGAALAANQRLFDELARLARQKECTPAQLALAWLLRAGDDIVPIPGTTRIARLEENAAAAVIQLTNAEWNGLARIFSPEAIQGTRYDAGGEALLEK